MRLYNAFERGAAEALGLKAVLEERPEGAHRRHDRVDDSEISWCWLGLGEHRHIEVNLLWVQESVRRWRFRIIKILGTTNLVNILTMPKSIDDIRARLAGVGVSIDLEKMKVLPRTVVRTGSRRPNPTSQAVARVLA